jgi:Tfp pilus assembly protein PilF
MWIPFTDRRAELARACAVACVALAVAACAASGPTPGAVTPGEPAVVDPVTQARFERAIASLENGEYEAAEAELVALTKDHPQFAGPWVNLGHLYATTGRIEPAVVALETAIALEPGHCAPYNELGVLARRAGKFADAEQNYKQGLSVDPQCPEAILNLGILYELYFGRFADALDAYRTYQSLADDPDPRVAGWVVDLERRTGS